MKTHILTVTQLTNDIKHLLESSFSEVWVEGEISNLSVPASGHAYFTLKDEQSQIRVVLFRSSQRFIKFTLQHGMQVICRGRVGVYEPRGEYQIILEYIEPKGVGALQVAFEQLKVRLEKEGLFDSKHKKQLPILPKRIGVVTSPTGAAIKDILRVIKRRHPRMQILIYPVPVQGAEAAPKVVEAVQYFNRERSVDVVIVGRGGGSLEDLWAFNEEVVARTLYASNIPIISAVGHETDYTIADFVADLRAPTPSAAAEMVAESEERFHELIIAHTTFLIRAIGQKIERTRTSLRENLHQLGDPRQRLEKYLFRIDELTNRLSMEFNHFVKNERFRLKALMSALDHLNPLNILSRGYSVTKKAINGLILKDTSQIRPGDFLTTTLYKGKVISRVEKIR